MPPDWLETIAWISLALAAICAALVAGDILVRGYRQPMRIMEVVWPVTALYLGPLGLLAYRRWGRPKSDRYQREHGETGGRPFGVRVAVSASHCGAGCTLGDIIATWVVFAAGLSVAGLALPYEYLFDFTFALALGIAFQFWAIRPMEPELARGVVGMALGFLTTYPVNIWLIRRGIKEAMS